MSQDITLPQLKNLFAQSAANEKLPKPIRVFAAQLTVFTAHVERTEKKADAALSMVRQLDKHIAELVGFVAKERPVESAPAAQADASAPPAAPTGSAPPSAAPAAQPAVAPHQEGADQEINEDEIDIEALAANMAAESEAEAAAAVTPLRKSKKAAPQAGGAA